MDYTYLVRLVVGNGQVSREKLYKLKAENISAAADKVARIGKELGQDFTVKEIKRISTRE